eukprot:CAMPEP_0119105868 /NCGR_PEP_ID=MMETSP1180-20130426/3722_1 /TAXON_ID=3052 ORGANISM="Chlamydomonas cf sp, Strain CCMP681" /NCGR_SAMPLE_ID=MMETSP1180 /ASSEMBLY_ACC=CAM_ASM_000741 /LENGTH=158 /DNA_ID=CAMNT_0007091041 /DNA_START=18 /DNA_END=494 /DNA_ORIENTATION=-
MALRQLCNLLPSSLRATGQRSFRAVADVEIDLADRETLKKYVGVRDHLSREAGSKASLMTALRGVLEAVKVLPSVSDYRRAVEATCQYRLSVCEANDADASIEEVLDAHMEELIKECKEEVHLIPLMNENRPWDVPATYSVPVFDYHDAAEVLAAPKK